MAVKQCVCVCVVAVWRIHQYCAYSEGADQYWIHNHNEEKHEENGHNEVLNWPPGWPAHWSTPLSPSVCRETAELDKGMIQTIDAPQGCFPTLEPVWGRFKRLPYRDL